MTSQTLRPAATTTTCTRAMSMDDDMWGAVATSPSPSLPQVISPALSLLAASGGGCYSNVAPAPFSSFSAADAASFAPLEAGPASLVLERETCLGPSAAAAGWGGTSAGPVERRKKRMIKNRDSASRSRARQQAHVTQIETEVLELREANEQLRLKYDQLRASVEVAMPVKKALQRVLSAPF